MRRTLLGMALLTAACGEKKPAATPPLAPAAAPVPLVPMYGFEQTFHADDIAKDTSFVVRDSAAWAATWKALHATVSPKPALPAIDFGTTMVAVAGLGQKPNGGFTVQITGADEEGGKVTVHVLAIAPGPTCATPQEITHPATAMQFPRRDGEVVFVRKDSVANCP